MIRKGDTDEIPLTRPRKVPIGTGKGGLKEIIYVVGLVFAFRRSLPGRRSLLSLILPPPRKENVGHLLAAGLGVRQGAALSRGNVIERNSKTLQLLFFILGQRSGGAMGGGGAVAVILPFTPMNMITITNSISITINISIIITITIIITIGFFRFFKKAFGF